MPILGTTIYTVGRHKFWTTLYLGTTWQSLGIHTALPRYNLNLERYPGCSGTRVSIRLSTVVRDGEEIQEDLRVIMLDVNS